MIRIGSGLVERTSTMRGKTAATAAAVAILAGCTVSTMSGPGSVTTVAAKPVPLGTRVNLRNGANVTVTAFRPVNYFGGETVDERAMVVACAGSVPAGFSPLSFSIHLSDNNNVIAGSTSEPTELTSTVTPPRQCDQGGSYFVVPTTTDAATIMFSDPSLGRASWTMR
jgi:hypothetical protein